VNTSNVLNKIKNILKIKNDKDLASLLEVSNSTIAAWKQRNTIDFEKIIKLAIKNGIDLNYLFADAFIFHEDKNQDKKKPNEFEEYVIFQLKKIRKLDRNSLFSFLNPKKEFLTRCLKQFKENEDFICDISLTTKNAKSILISLIKKCKKNLLFDSKTKEENVILEVEETFSNIECYVLLKFPEYFV